MHLADTKAAIKNMREARRAATRDLNAANNSENRKAFLEIDEVLKRLQQVLQEEKAMD